jgi:hypothetical protein
MIIDLTRLKELRALILDYESDSAKEQLNKCNNCGWSVDIHPECKVQDYCKLYSPLDEPENKLIIDLFDTVEHLNKIIDSMTNAIQKQDIDVEECITDCTTCIRNHFENKVKKGD